MNDNRKEISSRLYDALDYTFDLHGRDVRKGSEIPYMAHLLSVCALVQQDGGDEDEAIAALLHDALEDKPEKTSRGDISKLFGTRVLAIIEIATDTPPDYKSGDKKPPWRQRKEAYLERVRREDPNLLRVTIADKIDNARAILSDYRRIGDEIWERFNAGRDEQIWYYQSAIDAYREAGYNYNKGALLEDLQQLVVQLSKLNHRG